METQSKIALVTGSSRGLGREMALRLAEKGHDVVVTYQSQKVKADEVVGQIEAAGRKALALPFDAGDFDSLDGFVTRLGQALQSKWGSGKFDFLVNNAGIGATIPFAKATEADFDRFLNVHFKSVYFLCQKTLPMINDQGRIINISTGTTRFCNPGYSIYASMKGAIEVFSRYLAKETGPRGITVNVVAPGAIETDFNSAAIRNAPPERRNMLIGATALGRIGQPEDIGSVVAFLCSAEAGWINAQRIEVSGGVFL
jgi:NAD(P)-dependent dehydrogenase (short-subunit alcohol dehydrogenase family)